MLVDTLDTSLATEVSILDNVVVGSTTANKNLTVNGRATVGDASKSVGDLIVEATRFRVLSNITNKQTNGFSQLHFRSISGKSRDEIAKIYMVKVLVQTLLQPQRIL